MCTKMCLEITAILLASVVNGGAVAFIRSFWLVDWFSTFVEPITFEIPFLKMDLTSSD